MIKNLSLLITAVLCSGCASWFPTNTPSSPMDQATVALSTTAVAGCSPMLSWLGGICALSGMALLVLTGGRLGWRPIIGGVLFIVLNYALALYASWFFLPVVIATGAVSLAWAGKIVYRIINDDEIKVKEILK